ncbi:hypothetical protein AMTR_s01660p00008610, partial [Amborella trichopoda]
WRTCIVLVIRTAKEDPGWWMLSQEETKTLLSKAGQEETKTLLYNEMVACKGKCLKASAWHHMQHACMTMTLEANNVKLHGRQFD